MEELVTRFQRSSYNIKRYFLIIGLLCVILVLLLFVLFHFGIVIQNNEYVAISNYEDTNYIRSRNKRSTDHVNRDKNVQVINPSKNYVSIRKRRQNSHAQGIGKKRLIEMIDDLKFHLERCRKPQYQHNKKCEIFLSEMHSFSPILKKEIDLMNEAYQNEGIQPIQHIHEELEKNHHHTPLKAEKEKNLLVTIQRASVNQFVDNGAKSAKQSEKNEKTATTLKSSGFGIYN